MRDCSLCDRKEREKVNIRVPAMSHYYYLPVLCLGLGREARAYSDFGVISSGVECFSFFCLFRRVEEGAVLYFILFLLF